MYHRNGHGNTETSEKRTERVSVMDREKKKKSPVAVTCSALGTVLLAALVLLCLPLTVPRVLGYQIYTVISGSMEPAVPTGSLAYVSGAEAEEIEEGEIIAFYGGRQSTAIITHRVVENNTLEGEFTTKGDANEKEDLSPVPYEEFIGKVAYTIPKLGWAAQAFTSPYGKAGAVGAIGTAVALHLLGAAIEKSHEKRRFV